MTRWLLLIFAIAVGMLLPVQQGVNATLKTWLGNPLYAALASFATGTTAILLYVLVMRLPLPALSQAVQAPRWAWTGGLLGVVFVTAAILLAPRLGATATASAFIAGQILASLWLDHGGLLGFAHHPMNVGRLVGVVLLLAGVILIRQF